MKQTKPQGECVSKKVSEVPLSDSPGLFQPSQMGTLKVIIDWSIDKALLFRVRSIRRTVLCVNVIMATATDYDLKGLMPVKIVWALLQEGTNTVSTYKQTESKRLKIINCYGKMSLLRMM